MSMQQVSTNGHRVLTRVHNLTPPPMEGLLGVGVCTLEVSCLV